MVINKYVASINISSNFEKKRKKNKHFTTTIEIAMNKVILIDYYF